MYYWAPRNIKVSEEENTLISDFSNSQVFTAFKRGFKGNFPYKFDH